MNEKLFDSDAEAAVLGCMLFDEYGLNNSINALDSSDFYTDVYRAIFDCCKKLNEQGCSVDYITVKNKLDEMYKVNNSSTVLLDLVTKITTSAKVKDYVNIVADKSYRRNIIRKCNEIEQMAATAESAELMQSVTEVNDIQLKNVKCNAEKLNDILDREIEKTIEAKKNKKTLAGVSTGFRDLDDLIGGFEATDLIIIAGRPGMGKTSFALNVFFNICKKNKDKLGIFYSLEMSKGQLALRMYSSELNIQNDRFKYNTLSTDDLYKMQQFNDEFKSDASNIYITDEMSLTADEVISNTCHIAKKANKDANKDVAIIVIDYLQIMQIQGKGNKTDEIGAISRKCKQAAKEFNCPVVLLSQLNRDCDKRADHRPALADLRDSGNIEQDADKIIFLYRDELYNKNAQKGLSEIILAKQRNGPVGKAFLTFREQFTKFENREWGG